MKCSVPSKEISFTISLSLFLCALQKKCFIFIEIYSTNNLYAFMFLHTAINTKEYPSIVGTCVFNYLKKKNVIESSIFHCQCEWLTRQFDRDVMVRVSILLNISLKIFSILNVRFGQPLTWEYYKTRDYSFKLTLIQYMIIICICPLYKENK